MKFNHFFTRLSVALIAAASFFSCVQEEVLGDPSVTISESTLSFSAQEDAKTVELTSTLDWKLKGYTEDVKSWLSVTPDEGSASNKPVTITVAVLANAGKDRSVTIEFYGDKVHTASLTINQAGSQLPGDGSLENPYSATEARAVALALDPGTETSVAYYVHGFVKKFASKHEDGMNSFGNASFYFTDDATLEGEDFEAYQVYAPGNVKFTSLDQIKIGDEVIVYGKLTNYNGTPETVGKGAAYVYSINGKTEVDAPQHGEAVNATVAEFNAAPVDASKYYRLSGTVGGSINLTYGNFDLTDATGTVYVYGLSNINDVKDKLVAGAKITVVGTRGDYNGKIEVLNGTCESIEGGETPGPGPEPGEEGEFDSTIAWVLGTNAYDNTSSGNSKQSAIINGVSVSNVLKLGKSAAGGNATLTIPAGASGINFYAYGWKGKTVKLIITVEGEEYSVDLESNDGCAGNAPYTISASEDDMFRLNLGQVLESDLEITVATDAERAILFAIKPFVKVEVDYTLDMINQMDCYYDEDGDPYWMFDLYVSDSDNNCYSTLDICLFADAEKDANTISGEHEIWMGTYILNDGTKFDAEGLLSITCLSAEDEEYYGLFEVSVDLDLDNGEKLQYTFPMISALGYNFVTDEDIWLQDQPATKAAASRAKVARGTRQLRNIHEIRLR